MNVLADRNPPLGRRAFLKMTGAISTAALASGAPFAWGQKTTRKPTPPNILFIVAEDMGPTIGCYGDPHIKTPNIDRLAGQGVRFDRAFVTQASCSPSRSSILTGLYPHQNGQLGLGHYGYSMQGGLPTLPKNLQKAGYRTGIMGKLHVNPAKDMPFDYKGIGHGATRDVRKPPADFGAFLETVGDEPFFFYMNVADAHTPFTPQVAGFPTDPVTPEAVQPWNWLGVNTKETRTRVAGYYNCVRRVDLIVGKTLQVLEESGHAEDTLVVFIGDHGPAFCRGKTTCYEAGLRIPFIVRWPGQSPPGAVRRNLVSTVDILPTFLDAARAPLPPDLPGASLLSLLEDADAGWREYLAAEFATHGPTGFFPRRSIRDDRYKLIVNLLAEDRPCPYKSVDGCPGYRLAQKDSYAGTPVRGAYETWVKPPRLELYDLERDPAELTNLAQDPSLAAVRQRLLANLEEWQVATDDPLRDPEQLRKLTAFQDRVTADIRKRVARVREEAKKAGKKPKRRDVQRASAIKPEYFVPPRPKVK